MKRFLIASAVVAAISGPALAADPVRPLPPPPPVVEPFVFDPWAGPYLGAAIGWGHARIGERVFTDGRFLSDPLPRFTRFHADGVVAEIFGGFNWQRDSFVFGLEGAFEWTRWRDSQAEQFFRFQEPGEPEVRGFIHRRADVDWLARFVAHAGVAGDRWKVSANAGIGFGDIEVSHVARITDPGPETIFVSRDSRTRTGFTAGLSADFLVTHNVFLRGHYQFYHFGRRGGDRVVRFDDVIVETDRGRRAVNAHKVLVGIGFLFGAPPAPPPPVAVLN